MGTGAKLILHESDGSPMYLYMVQPGYPGVPGLWRPVPDAPSVCLEWEYQGEWIALQNLPTIQAVYTLAGIPARKGVQLWGSGTCLIITQAEWDAIVREYAAARARIDARIAEREKQDAAIAAVVAGFSDVHQAAYRRYCLSPTDATMAEDYGAAARLVEIQRALMQQGLYPEDDDDFDDDDY